VRLHHEQPGRKAHHEVLGADTMDDLYREDILGITMSIRITTARWSMPVSRSAIITHRAATALA
jgi:hypothetical protein